VEAKKVLEETFGRVKFNALPVESRGTAGNRTIGNKEKRVVVSFPARTRLMVAYHKPTLPDRDDYLFDLLDQILGQGRTSRLYKDLVLQKRVVSSVETSSGVPGARLPNLFLIELDPLGNHSPEEVLRLLDLEIEKMKKEGVTSGELSKAKKRLTVDLLWRLQTNLGLAAELSWFEVVSGSWKYLANYLEEIDRFRPEDIQDLANRYLNSSNRTIAILKP
jgi:predicted Zn-dependent peptidase